MSVVGLMALGVAPQAAADTRAAFCVEVLAQNVKVFKSPGGDEFFGQWTKGQRFVATGREGRYDRYKTYWREANDAWVTSNPQWTRRLAHC